MAQFDVHRNPGRQRDIIPYVVVLQNVRFDRSTTRLVAPLVVARHVVLREHHLAPRFTVAGEEVMLDVFNLATLPTERLDQPIASLADDASRASIIRALDELVSQA
ncbi:MAG: CcdB family protein [Gluconacetobacter diazotrophicus]|nr:CcdB family protein [Gluconacetobacter diazotrophicus]